MNNYLERLQVAIADRYVLEREVGRGGMATVHLAHDVRHDRAVAVKVLRPELGVLLGAERFLREIKVVARLQHPHILPVHDSGEVEGALYYVMPYVDGETLRDRLKREKQLPVPEVVRIGCEVADALDYAHRSGVVHRDIKPGNILLVEGHAVVADFGIARAVRAAGGEMWETLTDSGVALGTPAYMSPEQAIGDSGLDARSDIYSLGCVLYEMLVGEPPFTGPGGEVIVARRFTEPPPRVRAARPSVSPEVDDVVTRALARLPADRFASARELVGALTLSASGLPPLPPGITTGETTRERPRRSPAARLLIGGGIATVAALALWLGALRQRPARTPSAPAVASRADSGAAAAAASRPVPAASTAETLRAQSAGALPSESARAAARPPLERTEPLRGTARPPARELRQAAPARPTPPGAATPRLDSVFSAMQALARQARRQAVTAGAASADLAPGDTLFASAQRAAARGRWSDAISALSTVTATWKDAARIAAERAEAARVAAARREADTQAVRPPVPTPPAPAPQPPAPEPVATPSATAGIEEAISRYARALESRSIAELRRAYPGLTAAQQQSWQQFFGDVRSIQVALTLGELRITGEVAEARVTGRLEYVGRGSTRPESQPVAFHATFARDASGWRLTAVRQ